MDFVSDATEKRLDQCLSEIDTNSPDSSEAECRQQFHDLTDVWAEKLISVNDEMPSKQEIAGSISSVRRPTVECLADHGIDIDRNDLYSIYPSLVSLEDLVIERRLSLLFEDAGITLADGLITKAERTSQVLQPFANSSEPVALFVGTLTQELDQLRDPPAPPQLGPWDDLALGASGLTAEVPEIAAAELKAFSQEVSTLLTEYRLAADTAVATVEGDVDGVSLALTECGGFGTSAADPSKEQTLTWIDDNRQDLEDLDD